MNYTTMHSPSNNKPMLQGAKPPANNVINNQLQVKLALNCCRNINQNVTSMLCL